MKKARREKVPFDDDVDGIRQSPEDADATDREGMVRRLDDALRKDWLVDLDFRATDSLVTIMHVFDTELRAVSERNAVVTRRELARVDKNESFSALGEALQRLAAGENVAQTQNLFHEIILPLIMRRAEFEVKRGNFVDGLNARFRRILFRVLSWLIPHPSKAQKQLGK